MSTRPPSAKTRPTWQSPLLPRPSSTGMLPVAVSTWNRYCRQENGSMCSVATASTSQLPEAGKSGSTGTFSSRSARSPTAWSVRVRDVWDVMNWKTTSFTPLQPVAICVNLRTVCAVKVWRGAGSVMKQMVIQSSMGQGCASRVGLTTVYRACFKVALFAMKPMDTCSPKPACAGHAGWKTVPAVLTPRVLTATETMAISSTALQASAKCVNWETA